MSNIAESWLTSYVRAWERHQIHFSLRGPLSIDADQPPRLPASGEKEAQMLPEHPAAVTLSGGPLTYRFSHAHHDWKKRGEPNANFLDPGMLQDVLLPALGSLAPRAQLVILCLAPIYATEDCSVRAFLAKLDRFLAGLPPAYRYAVGIKNPDFLLPDYCACLQNHGVAHLFDETGMPSLLDQIQVPGILTAEHAVCWNTQEPGPGRSMNGEWELGIVETVRRCVTEKKRCFFYLDEHLGVASLETLMTMLNADLAKLSPIRKQAA